MVPERHRPAGSLSRGRRNVKFGFAFIALWLCDITVCMYHAGSSRYLATSLDRAEGVEVSVHRCDDSSQGERQETVCSNGTNTFVRCVHAGVCVVCVSHGGVCLVQGGCEGRVRAAVAAVDRSDAATAVAVVDAEVVVLLAVVVFSVAKVTVFASEVLVEAAGC